MTTAAMMARMGQQEKTDDHNDPEEMMKANRCQQKQG